MPSAFWPTWDCWFRMPSEGGTRLAGWSIGINSWTRTHRRRLPRRRPPRVQVGVTWRDPIAGLTETGKKWDEAGIGWACTGTVAASVIGPHLMSGTSADVYVDADTIAGLEDTAVRAGLRAIEGGRLTLRPFPTVTVRRLAVRADELLIAPWPRIYADLRTTGVRGEEAAEHLREVMHGR